MRLLIRNRAIDAPIETILKKVQSETTYLKDISTKKGEVICTCPFHKDGQESKPACFVLSNPETELEYGTFHCFACGAKGPLSKLVGKCYDRDSEWGKKWLVDNFSSSVIEYQEFLPKIEEKKKSYLDESVLNDYEYDNEIALNYLINKRHLTKEVIDLFKIGYEVGTKSITFPCRNKEGKLVGIFKRSVEGKFFTIPEISPKPIYLLDYIIKNGITSVVVCESQINALTLWSWGIPAIALFGTGSYEQYEILKKSGIRKYFLAFDGDLAGEVGCNKFILNLGKESLIKKIVIPQGKDVNDLTKEEFDKLEVRDTQFFI